MITQVQPRKHRRSPRQRDLERVRKEAAEMKIEILPAASPVRARGRHWGILLSFILMVALPLGLGAGYLFTRAADQYASFIGFTVRQANAAPAVELLGGITDLSGASTIDTDVLYSFLDGQELVRKIDDEIDLVSIWSKPENDPIFTFDPEGTIEDLVRHWRRMIAVSYDSGAGLIEIRALAFDPKDAYAINQAIFNAGSELVNELSAIARDDTTRYAKEDLDRALERLKKARIVMTAFRNDNQIVDPEAVIQGQVGLMNNLQQQLATTLIDFALLQDRTTGNDPRLEQAKRKIEVIRNQISEERSKLGFGSASTASGSAFANMVGEYESLIVDLEFAQLSYTTALAAYDHALAEANRQNRYLASYLRPTLAESSQFPRKPIILCLVALFLFLFWSIIVLVYYSLKDRQARL